MERGFDSDFYKRILDRINSNLYITNVETDEIVYMNDYMKKSFGFRDVEGQTCWKLLKAGQTERCAQCKAAMLQDGQSGKVCLWREKNPITGRVYLNHSTLEHLGERTYHVTNAIDITDQVQLSTEASIDELTGVFNRNAGKKRLGKLLDGPEGAERFTIALYDINGLKWVNDTYGHLEGDHLLRFVAQNIQKELEGEDFVFRLSGDEFIVVFLDKDMDRAREWMERIIQRLEERRTASRINYEASFSYGLAAVDAGEHLSVSDLLSVADTQMYIQKRDHHITESKKKLRQDRLLPQEKAPFQYNKDHLFEALAESMDGYPFVGNLKTGEFMYSYKMVHEFELPGQVVANAAAFWAEKIHPDDAMRFLRGNQEVADGRAERHALTYRAKNAEGEWVHLLCKGRMIRDEEGRPDIFAGVIRDLDKVHSRSSSASIQAGRKIIGQDRVEEYIASMLGSPAKSGEDMTVFVGEDQDMDRERAFYILDGILRRSSEDGRDGMLDFINRNIPEGILAAYDKPGYPIFCFNQALLDYTGYTYEELLQVSGSSYLQLIHPDDRAMVREEVSRQLEEKGVIELRYRLQNKRGEEVWIWERGLLVVGEEGQRVILSFMLRQGTGEERVRDLERSAISRAEDAQRALKDQLSHTEQLFRIARQHSRLNIWEYDIDGHRIIQSKDSQTIHGHGPVVEDVPESLIRSGYVHPDSVENTRKIYRKLEAGETEVSAAIQVRLPQSDQYWWEKVTYINQPEAAGQPRWAVGVSEDVTAQKEAELRVYQEETMHELLAWDLMYSFRLNMTRNRVEESWRYSGGKARPVDSDANCDTVFRRIMDSIANEDDRKRFQANYSCEMIKECVAAKNPIPDFEYRKKRDDGMIVWVALNLRGVTAPSTGEQLLFGYARNIDMQKKRELALRKKAEIDELTGLYNYNTVKLLVEDVLGKRLEQAGGDALILLDVDSFKLANQAAGFLGGDQVLKEMSARIRENLPVNSIVGRMNADVFLIFLYDMGSDREIRQLAEDLRRSLSRTYNIQGQQVPLTVSGGISFHFTTGMSYDQMYQYALHALDNAKRGGGDRLLSYEEVETANAGIDMEMEIDPDSYRIVRMNVTGMIAFGLNAPLSGELKCYQLLHGRTEPCPFCAQKLSFEKARLWECFVSRLNRLMYVQEQLLQKDGGRVRSIRLRETPFGNQREGQQTKFYALLEESWSNIERGGDCAKVCGDFLEYAGGFYQARRVLLFQRGEKDQELKQTHSWKLSGLSGKAATYVGRSKYLEETMHAVFPRTSIRVERKGEVGYDIMARYYGTQELDGPVLLSAIYDSDQLTTCILVEGPSWHVDLLKPLETVTGFLRRTQTMYQLRVNYERAMDRDQKTGLLNYNAYARAIQNANSDVYSTLGMVGAHIMDLRKYNTKYGLGRGDGVLKSTARIMAEVFGDERCYRISGATFLALCPDFTYEHFSSLCVRLEKQLERAYPGMVVCVKVWEQNAISVPQIQSQVEEKIQMAISQRRSQGYLGDDQMIAEIMAGIQQSITGGGLCTFLQPKADVRTGAICGAEALVRYRDKDKGIVPPNRFLPGIEKAGLIRHVDLFVLRDVCRMVKTWLAEGWEPFPISLNFSRNTILENGILEETDRIVEESGVPKNLIQIEVTETIGSVDGGSLKDIVDRFVEAGYHIALDDFGAEYSNIYVLYSLNLDTLKLDRRIVGDIYHDGRARLVVENVIGICRQLGITCVAEGVETQEHLAVLKELSCDVIQGYYLNKPLAEADFKKRYVRERRKMLHPAQPEEKTGSADNR